VAVYLGKNSRGIRSSRYKSYIGDQKGLCGSSGSPLFAFGLALRARFTVLSRRFSGVLYSSLCLAVIRF